MNYLLEKYGAPEEIYNGKKVKAMLAVSQILAESYYLQGVEEGKAKEEKIMEAKMVEEKTHIASALIKDGVSKNIILNALTSNNEMSEADAEKLYNSLIYKVRE